jgi:hypothetical protein
MPVATIGHLLAMKVLADREGRENDAGDIYRLLDVADEEEIRLARESLELITERGFNRGKDLQAEFDRFLAAREGR